MIVKGRSLVLVELNEINFDVVERYVQEGVLDLPAFRALLSGPRMRTSSEEAYEELEPWIQWPSVHTGRTYGEHGIFRLGDIVGSEAPQLFELLEQSGFRVGVISAMNAENRLRSPAYYLPDPWTATPSDGSAWSKGLTAAVAQTVNDNSQGRITASSVAWLIAGLLRFARVKNYLSYLSLAAGALREPWRKALFLDLFMNDLHWALLTKRKPHFSTLFLNAGAHIQHHYFHNAGPLRRQSPLRNPEWYVSDAADPVAQMLVVYDRILSDYLAVPGLDLIVATGLSQRPYDRVKFYYRLKNHGEFLRMLGIKYASVTPRMTRDFLVEFGSVEEAAKAEAFLGRIRVSDGSAPLFGDIDNRGSSLFVTLTYPDEICPDTTFEIDGVRRELASHTVFVAIKNGMHQAVGFAFFRGEVGKYSPPDGAHVKELYHTIMNYFRHSSVGSAGQM